MLTPRLTPNLTLTQAQILTQTQSSTFKKANEQCTDEFFCFGFTLFYLKFSGDTFIPIVKHQYI